MKKPQGRQQALSKKFRKIARMIGKILTPILIEALARKIIDSVLSILYKTKSAQWIPTLTTSTNLPYIS